MMSRVKVIAWMEARVRAWMEGHAPGEWMHVRMCNVCCQWREFINKGGAEKHR